MALTGSNNSSPASGAPLPPIENRSLFENQTKPVLPRLPLPLSALGRLPELHAETSESARLASFLQSAVHAAAAMMLLGALAAATSTTLSATFGWALLLLVGVGALLRSYIYSTAAAFDRAPLHEAAKDLRAVLAYTGVAWGAGAFLALPAQASAYVVVPFAVLPSLTIAWLMDDRDGVLAFVAPVTLLSLAAALVRPFPAMATDAVVILMLQSSIVAVAVLRRRRGQTRLPAGLSLR